MSVRTADAVAFAVVLAVAAVGVLLLPQLPERVAVHFGAGGTPDNYVSPRVAVVSIPAVSVLTVALVRVAERLDPPSDPRSVDAVVVGTSLLLGAVHLLVLGWNVGYAVPVPLVVLGAVLWTLVLAGYVVVREV